MEPEPYFKIYNDRNQLLLVTPSKSSVVELLESKMKRELTKSELGGFYNGSRFIGYFRVDYLKL